MNQELSNLIQKYLNIEFEKYEDFYLITISKSNLIKIISKLKNQDQLAFRFLINIVVKPKDFVENTFEIIYFLFSFLHKKILGVSVKLSLFNIDSIMQIFPIASFLECEVFEKFNINFINNTNIQKLFEKKSSETSSHENSLNV